MRFPGRLGVLTKGSTIVALAEQRRQERLSQQAAKLEEGRRERLSEQAAKLDEERRKQQADAQILNTLVEKVRLGKWLEKQETMILEDHGKHSVLAQYYVNQHERTGNVLHLIRASSAYRRGGQPGEALEATERFMHRLDELPSHLRSMLLTTRGGALRDIRDLDQAELCAREAIKCDGTSPQPYNLLGAILN